MYNVFAKYLLPQPLLKQLFHIKKDMLEKDLYFQEYIYVYIPL